MDWHLKQLSVIKTAYPFSDWTDFGKPPQSHSPQSFHRWIDVRNECGSGRSLSFSLSLCFHFLFVSALPVVRQTPKHTLLTTSTTYPPPLAQIRRCFRSGSSRGLSEWTVSAVSGVKERVWCFDWKKGVSLFCILMMSIFEEIKIKWFLRFVKIVKMRTQIMLTRNREVNTNSLFRGAIICLFKLYNTQFSAKAVQLKLIKVQPAA